MRPDETRTRLTRKDWRAVAVLLVVVTLSAVVPRIVARYRRLPPVDPARFERLMAHEHRQAMDERRRERMADALDPVPFDPNSATAQELQAMGLPASVASTWTNFTAAGGRFREPGDIARVYGLRPAHAEQLEPYVQIARTHSDQGEDVEPDARSTPQAPSVTERLEINTADSAALDGLRGIGPVFARRIVRYRDWLGGFHSLDQLDEVYGLPPETLDHLHTVLTVDTARVERIHLHDVDEAFDLFRHPYISEDQARDLLSVWRADTAQAIGGLNETAIFDALVWNRLRPYLRRAHHTPR